MGAALGAAGDMQAKRRVEALAEFPGNLGGDVAGGDHAGRTGRRAGTGGDADARIGWGR